MPAERPRWGWRREVRGLRAVPERAPEPGDEALMERLASGHQEALGPLYSRYAARIFSLAAQSLDRAAAEEIVQDVFLAVWRKAGAFTPERGTFRAWVFQIAHHRILNELRRRSRQPRLADDLDEQAMADAADPALDPGEVFGRDAQRETVRRAVEALPPDQRRAIELAFFQELTHSQVASTLQVPLGTTKTRIRAGVQKLRESLAPAVAVLVLGALILAAAAVVRQEQAARGRDARAIALLTSSETVAIRLRAAPGVPAATHGVYRGQPGAAIAVVTLEDFPPAPAGSVYQVWVRRGSVWTSLATVRPDPHGDARVILERPDLTVLPQAVEVTVEPAGGSAVPRGTVIVNGQAPAGR
jgi:RNA polymerase sigma factor (sigma-70 family)